jgi:hypothetical protein
VVVLVGATIFGATQLMDRSADVAAEPTDPTSSSLPTTGPSVSPVQQGPPLLTPMKLDGAMLSMGDLNSIVGSTDMTIEYRGSQMSNDSTVVDNADCLAVTHVAQALVYTGSGSIAVRDEMAYDPDPMDHWVQQAAVLFGSAERAQTFLRESQTRWERCTGQTIRMQGEPPGTWRPEAVNVQENLIAQYSSQIDGAEGWGCQHVLATAINLIVETQACGHSVTDQAVTMAKRMIAQATKS